MKAGQVANRVVTVGDPVRAERIALLLDQEPKPFKLASHRGFLTITGKYQGVPVSIIAIGMGFAMMDFFVREVRAVLEPHEELCVIRLGSCGAIGQAQVGSLIIPKEAYSCTRNYDFFLPDSKETEQYRISKPVKADAEIRSALLKSLSTDSATTQSNTTVHSNCLSCSADSFYSSQGRIDPYFSSLQHGDNNADLIPRLRKEYPTTEALEMETFMLLHLASVTNGGIRAAGVHMCFADRVSNAFITPAQVDDLERRCAKGVLDAIINISIPSERLHEPSGSVWA